MTRILFTLFLLFFCGHSFSKTNILILATTEWCPYTCIEQTPKDNIIGRYLTYVFKNMDIELSIDTFPWSRSIFFAEKGMVNGLLTAVKSEAPSLLFTSTPIAFYQVCFYTEDAHWLFNNTGDLKDKKLGIIQNYGYSPEIDSYINDSAASKNLEVISGTNGSSRLLRMLLNDRVDVIVEDNLVLVREAQKYNIDMSSVRNAGCTKPQPFYLALHPTVDGAEQIIALLNEALKQTDNLNFLQSLILELDITD